jgi:hypothetical protein
MNMKEFDAKQFLLEKGERVGLGAAITLMVLMLVLSLFMPSKGIFSGSPKTKADELNKDTRRLEDDLHTRVPGPADKPDEREGKLIKLNTELLDPDQYATAPWFEPRMKENKARRPPKIYNVAEAVAVATEIPIDTYLFRWKDPPSILVLEDANRRGGFGVNAQGGGMNPFANLMKGMQGGRGTPPSTGPMMPGRGPQTGQGQLGFLQQLQGAADNTEYQAKWISLDSWNQNQLTARQLRPLRMAIIAASFPYKEQLEEHKNRLRLKTIDDVLAETIGEGEKKSAAFDFRGAVVERREVDADGKPIGEWLDPQLKESYQVWLQNTYYPFEPEDPKYALVKPNEGKGLVMPLLRAFRSGKADAPGLPMLSGMGGMGMMLGAGKGMPSPNLQLPNAGRQANAPTEEFKSKYPDVAADLPKLKDTLEKLKEAQPNQIKQAQFQKAEFLDAFNPNASLPGDKTQTTPTNMPQTGTNKGSTEQSYVPDYVMVRVVDVNIEPGKHYKYRLKMKMANPNYQNPNVASPEYKEKEELKSDDWYELPQIVSVPQELYYYVVDEAQNYTNRNRDKFTMPRESVPRESAQYRLLFNQRSPAPDQVVFQFHRWVEQTQQSRKDTEMIPVGEWAVADRVFVSRGEYIGRKVIVDLPIWKYTQNTFILPAESTKINRKAGKPNTGIDVDFGQDPAENNMILVDFEGGRGVSVPGTKISDDCATEVLMLTPDGKLQARNSVKDTGDTKRTERREAVLKRIQDVREGKAID